jgi:CysZ protein
MLSVALKCGSERSSVFAPIARSISQLDDPAFRRVLLQTIAWSIVCFAAVDAATIWGVHRLLELHGLLAWVADILGSIGASLLALWFFLPVATAIGMMYVDQIAGAVERRFYPWLPPPGGASLLDQAWDGAAVAVKILALNIVALILAFVLPGVGLILGWMIASYAIGRGLFVAIAMRRMPRPAAESLYRANRGIVLLQGAILALMAYVPVMNLLIPIIGSAAMVHVLDMCLSTAETSARKLV